MISGLYFRNMPDHMKPAKAKCEATRNRALRFADRDHSGRYAVAQEGARAFKLRILPKIEQARRRGDVVRFTNGRWTINGQTLKA